MAQNSNNDWVVENIHGPSQVGIIENIPVDINQDGMMDVVSVSNEDGDLRAYINQGNLGFEQQYISTDVLGAYRVSSTDFNNDGEVDFLIPSIESQEIIALIADPEAMTFGYRKQIIASNVLLPTDAQAGDFNNDGLMDVVSLSFEENLVLLHLQDNQGGFNTSILSESPQRPRKLVVEDFNGDQRLDVLLVSSEDNSVWLLENFGDIGFAEKVINNQMSGTVYVTACDINNDELIDFAVAATENNSIHLFTNDGTNQYLVEVIDLNTLGPRAMMCADVDGDDRQELISLAARSGRISRYELSGDFEKTMFANIRDGYNSINFADFGALFGPQVLTQAFFDNRNLLYNPNESQAEDVVWQDFPDGAYHIASGDIDGDGDVDAVVAEFRQDQVYWLEKNNNQFTPRTISTAVDGPQSVVVKDIDNDSDLDVVSAGAWDNSIWLHKNDGSGVFETSLIFDSAFNAARAQIEDMNGDGLSDVVATSSLDNSVRVFLQNESGFLEQLIETNLIGAYDVKIDDFNQDGHWDILASGLRDSPILLFINDGLSHYSTSKVYNKASRTNSISSQDINGDGYPDISLIQDGSVINLLNGNDLQFDLTSSLIDIGSIRDFILVNDTTHSLALFCSVETGDFYVNEDLLSNDVENLVVSNKFMARSLGKIESKDAYYAASNIDNSVKWIYRDLIAIISFE